MREYIPKSVAPERVANRNKKRAQQEYNRRWRLKKKAEKERTQLRRYKEESMAGVPFDQREDLLEKLGWAKETVYKFMVRTGRSIDFDEIHRLNKRLGRRTTDFLPGGNSLSLTFDVPGRRRKGLNRDKAQQAARQMRIPYWREMQADELRAALLILIHKEGIDMFGRPVE